ncbi:MAG TPA: regulatory iron-sulfur-containing complex subunit RicT [Gemmatimonadales bacterium]|nr:regulatory iron-sulfur-containing complex subunit RicT [Gemmatimonadales bacterium]
MSRTVEVAFKGTRRGYFTAPESGDPLRIGESVVVEAERGRDLGRITALGEVADKKCGGCSGCATSPVAEAPAEAPRRAVLRRATPDELRTLAEVRRSEEDARRKVVERVRAHSLVMKVSDTEWQFDRNKLTIYFTAEKRVDFRALVRDLASTFRTRIELRQIGVRDEAARLSGVGRCGREYCCSTWLKELSPVNLGLAKDQHLSLNPSQISGGCGRLLCCLKYEHDFYVAARKRFPKEGKTLRTTLGVERVVAVDIFRERVFLRGEEQGGRIISLLQLHEEVESLGDVLLTGELRARLAEEAAAARAVPEAEGGMVADPSAPGGQRPNRRRRRRGSGPSRPPPETD